MRRGPKFELTQDMIVANIKTVYQRLGAHCMTRLLYEEHGSFPVRAIERKWGWAKICMLAGVPHGKPGKPRGNWKPCRECLGRLAVERYCWTCKRRMRRNQGGIA